MEKWEIVRQELGKVHISNGPQHENVLIFFGILQLHNRSKQHVRTYVCMYCMYVRVYELYARMYSMYVHVYCMHVTN